MVTSGGLGTSNCPVTDWRFLPRSTEVETQELPRELCGLPLPNTRVNKAGLSPDDEPLSAGGVGSLCKRGGVLDVFLSLS